VKVYQVLLIYQYLSLPDYQVLPQHSQEAYQVLEFWECFWPTTQPNPPKKLKISTQPNPTQPVGPT